MNRIHAWMLTTAVSMAAGGIGTHALAQDAKAVAPKPRAAASKAVPVADVGDGDLKKLIALSFHSKGPATLDGVLQQDPTQQACSQYPDRTSVPEPVAKKIEAAEIRQVKYPADGKYLGDWKVGEQIAQNGRGMQFSDPVGGTNGANCYACHQLTKAEISFGNIGPSLYQYGKLRGNSEAVIKYTWGKIWDSNAFSACSNMPRFGHKGILTEQQIRDVMALLLDPASPVNQ
ncbi:sulfur oxidation c-type cytochrome SoxX [Cupriavidus plantarum]|uniref:sulfur oxidation c-type cytochrome SoxX n=2 Tax=Cupriavidus plantarum TaxID=942865 RepID=UPI000E221A2F|nr:sulfur oxidation c-type cytochrome SoxX [Cupriavidus plantarum]REE86340.1 monoheme cytochrome SoxX (sulfur oxidation) [Cupriavidus plantarum]